MTSLITIRKAAEAARTSLSMCCLPDCAGFVPQALVTQSYVPPNKGTAISSVLLEAQIMALLSQRAEGYPSQLSQAAQERLRQPK